jgi:acyl-coenzyme A thioesterase PaaI-like protein
MTTNASFMDDRYLLNQAQTVLNTTRLREHKDCVFCGNDDRAGLRIEFKVCGPGSVQGRFHCPPLLQSYPETLHGGFTSALLDAAMTNCLFSQGVVAVTAELTVRYLKPIQLDLTAEITGTLKSQAHPLYYMTGELHQERRLVARAKATFFERTRAATFCTT